MGWLETYALGGLLLRGTVPMQQVFMLAGALTMCLMALYLAGISPLIRAGCYRWTAYPRRWGWDCYGDGCRGMVYAALLLALSTAYPAHSAPVRMLKRVRHRH